MAAHVDLPSPAATLDRDKVRSHVADAGIIPNARFADDEEAVFAAGALTEAGVSAIEVSITFPGSLHAISRIATAIPTLTIGAGNVLDPAMGQRCVDAGASFLVTDGLIPDVVEFAAFRDVAVISGALTPSEIIAAWRAGSDFVKVFPCDAVGGAAYIKSVKTALPQIRLIAAGGVDQSSAFNFMKAGATALSVGKEVIHAEAIRLRQGARIQELARRLLNSVDSARP